MPPTIRTVQLDFASRDFPASLVTIDQPSLPAPDWARIEVLAGGICGSDLHIFSRTTGPSPTLMSYVGHPIQLGHEIAGRVVESGQACPVGEGTLVAVDPVIACEARGIDPPCAQCRVGRRSVCEHLGSHVLTSGMGLGFTTGLGGGWGDQVLAHHSMLHPAPDGLDEQAVSLHEPLSIAVHGLLRAPPVDGDPVLIVGAGIIGLCAVAALTHLFPSSPVTVLAKHPHQADAAKTLGASAVVAIAPDGSHLEALANQCGSAIKGQGDSRMLTGGFPYVVEAVGTPAAVTETLRLAAGRGTVLLLGAAGVSEVDLTPVWFKELALVGAFCHADDPHGGAPANSIDRALDLLAAGALPPKTVITHAFPRDSFRDAITVALDRGGAGAIKVVLTP